MAEQWQAVPFERWTLKEAKDVVGTLADDEAERCARLYAGDGWLDGEGWFLPLPEGEGAGKAIERLREGFVHEPLIAEAADNHRDGAIAREPL